jgi:hypothetical protein
MILTPLEMVLGAAVLSFLVNVATRSLYVCKSDCEARHRTLDKQISKLFTMTKILVLSSKDVSPEEKNKLMTEGRD